MGGAGPHLRAANLLQNTFISRDSLDTPHARDDQRRLLTTETGGERADSTFKSVGTLTRRYMQRMGERYGMPPTQTEVADC